MRQSESHSGAAAIRAGIKLLVRLFPGHRPADADHGLMRQHKKTADGLAVEGLRVAQAGCQSFRAKKASARSPENVLPLSARLRPGR